MGLFVLERCYLCDTHTSGKLYYTNDVDTYTNDKPKWNSTKNSRYYVCDVLENFDDDGSVTRGIDGRICKSRTIPCGVYGISTEKSERYDTVTNPSVSKECGWTVGDNHLDGTPVICGNKNFESVYWHYGKSASQNEGGLVLGKIDDFSRNFINLSTCLSAIEKVKKIFVENGYKKKRLRIHITRTDTNLIDDRMKADTYDYNVRVVKDDVFDRTSPTNIKTLGLPNIDDEVARSYDTLSSTKFVIKKNGKR